MALNIKDPETERLVAEVARLSGSTKTGAVREAMSERLERLRLHGARPERRERLRRLLEDDVWPTLGVAGDQDPLPKADREELLGYGPDGCPA